MPLWQVIEHIRTYQPADAGPAQPPEFTHRFDRVAGARTGNLNIRNFKSNPRTGDGGIDRKSAHMKTFRWFGEVPCRRLMRGAGTGDKKYPVVPCRLCHRPRAEEVPMVNG